VRSLEGDQVLVRVFIGEADRWHHQPLHVALLERLRKEGFAGATVVRATAGFGARSVIHTAQILRLSEDLPMIVEIVEDEAAVERLKPILDEMVSEGLVTIEKVHVLRYLPTPPRK
jgi:PII-like signaling protein